MSLNRDVLLDLYRRLCLCREFELALVRFGTADSAPLGHPYGGQEAVAAGVCASLQSGDALCSTHRSHGHAVAMGCDLQRLALELYGRAEGLCGGRAGEMYVCQPEIGYFGGTQIVGGNLAMATGLALSARLSGQAQATVAFVGDGGVNQGVMYEALNLSAIWALPVIFVVEDNGYAQTTPVQYATSGNVVRRASGFDVASVEVDGQDATDVYTAVSAARSKAVAGDGPTLVHARTYRYEGHYFGDRHTRYRAQTEVEQWRERDPLQLHLAKLLAAGIDAPTAAAVSDLARQRATEAFERARQGAPVTLSGLLDDVMVDLATGALKVDVSPA